jgi:ankyrin repeat protein
LAAGTDVNEKDADGAKTPLMHAVFWGHKEIAEVLVSNGGDTNITDKHAEATSLHYSVLGHHWEPTEDRYSIVAVLIESGADVNAIANQGRITRGGGTTLDMAIESNQVEIADLLRKHGGKTKKELTAAEPVPEAAKPEPPTAKAPDISIHEAARDGLIEAVKQHLPAGTDVDAKNTVGSTALHRAAANGQKEIAELLIANGAEVNAKKKNGYTPLHQAARSGHKEVAELLIAEGADVNANDKHGMIPLHSAAFDGHKEIVELLIANGADVNAKKANGETPLDWANAGDKKEIADLLRKHGAKTAKELKAEVK